MMIQLPAAQVQPAVPGAPATDTNDPLKRTTSYGTVVGSETVEGAWAWLGIPYAAPPEGALRWKAPQDPASWEGEKQALEFSGECPQYTDMGEIIGDEDCLYLNVWRPQTDETDLPVYFWIHGGGNSIGTASTPFYDGSNIVTNGNLVVVTINYRLGPMGWFAHPSLRNGSPGRLGQLWHHGHGKGPSMGEGQYRGLWR